VAAWVTCAWRLGDVRVAPGRVEHLTSSVHERAAGRRERRAARAARASGRSDCV